MHHQPTYIIGNVKEISSSRRSKGSLNHTKEFKKLEIANMWVNIKVFFSFKKHL